MGIEVIAGEPEASVKSTYQARIFFVTENGIDIGHHGRACRRRVCCIMLLNPIRSVAGKQVLEREGEGEREREKRASVEVGHKLPPCNTGSRPCQEVVRSDC